MSVRWHDQADLIDSHVVDETRSRLDLSRAFLGLPDTDELDKEIVAEARVQHLTEQENIGGQGRLKHDWHVRGVEKTDWVRSTHSSLTRRLDWNLDTEALQVDDSAEDGDRSEEVGDVGQVLAVKGFFQCQLLVWPGDQEMYQSDDGTLELWSSASVDGRRRESLPDN